MAATAIMERGVDGGPSTRASLRTVLLALLDARPNTGYGLGRLLRHELRHLWEARLQQIYSELAALQRQGLVEVEAISLANRPAKKVYSLTEDGRRALAAWLRQPPAPRIDKDELLVQLYRIERAPPEAIVRRLEQRRDESVQRLAQLRSQLAHAPRTDPSQAGHLLTLEAAIARVEAEATWSAKVIAAMKGAAAGPDPSVEAGRSSLGLTSA
jgi:DNA-binding PadR family transcriptional regulator